MENSKPKCKQLMNYWDRYFDYTVKGNKVFLTNNVTVKFLDKNYYESVEYNKIIRTSKVEEAVSNWKEHYNE